MKKLVILLGSVTLIFIVTLSGCSTQNNNEYQGNDTNETEGNTTIYPENDSRFIGLWITNPVDNNWTFEFFLNRSFQRMEGIVDGSYQSINGKLMLRYTDDIWMPDTYSYAFSDNNTTLTLIQSSPYLSVTLYRQ